MTELEALEGSSIALGNVTPPHWSQNILSSYLSEQLQLWYAKIRRAVGSPQSPQTIPMHCVVLHLKQIRF